MNEKSKRIRDLFISEWGILGSAWGITRTMAQIQAFLMSCSQEQSTDDIMEALDISRGNAHSNLKELMSWGMVKKSIKKGDRKEYFTTEKDPWKIFCLVAKERRRREIEPVLEILKKCQLELKGSQDKESQEFNKQIQELTEFVEMGNRVMSKVSQSEKNYLLKWLLKMI